MSFHAVPNKAGTSQVGAIDKAQMKSNGGPLETKKIEKVAQCQKKIERGDSLFPSSFVGYV